MLEKLRGEREGVGGGGAEQAWEQHLIVSFQVNSSIRLRARYAMSGTDIRRVGVPGLLLERPGQRPFVPECSVAVLSACIALPMQVPTEQYDATRSCTTRTTRRSSPGSIDARCRRQTLPTPCFSDQLYGHLLVLRACGGSAEH
eukprot:602930-Rhodomonas_salina.1